MNLNFAALRANMLEKQLRSRGIRDPQVLQAMGDIPREEFVPEGSRPLAYDDGPVSIGYGQTISQPYMAALMAQTLGLTNVETVLDVGAGSGYHAALLGRLAAKVTSIEIVPALAEYARENLARTGLDANILVINGDGGSGAPEYAPFDAISVAAGAREIPTALIEQLNDSGRLVIPIGSLEDQELRVVTKRGGRMESRVVSFCRFVPFRGEQGWR